MDVFWPRDLLVPKRVDFWPETMSRSGGRAVTGAETLVMSASVRWRASMSFAFSTRETDKILTWRAIRGRLYGRARPLLIGPFDIVTPARLAGEAGTLASTFDDAAPFADGATFQQTSREAEFVSSASLSDTMVTIAPIGSWTPKAGQYFGPEEGRMHQINAMWETSGGWSCEIIPPLRSDYSSGQRLDFERMTCRMRLSADDGMRSPIDVSTLADPSIELEEIV